MIANLLNVDSIQLNCEATDWEEAIRKAATPLLNADSIEESYIDAMITSTREHGPYIVIAKSIAMPHARPEQGVNEIGISIATLKKPINFGHTENDPVDIVIPICAVDSNSHIELLTELATLLDDSDFIDMVRNSQNPSEVLQFIQNYKFD